MKLVEQRDLLERLKGAETVALELYNSGVEISRVIKSIRSAKAELSDRVAFLEEDEKSRMTLPKLSAVQQQQKTQEPTAEQKAQYRQQLLDQLTGLTADQLQTEKNKAEKALAKNPERTDLPVRLEVIAELLATKTK